MTKVAEFKDRVTLLMPLRQPDGQGGYVTESWDRKGPFWAKVLKPRFWAGQTGAGSGTAITQGIELRTRTDIGYDWLVEHRGKRYKILHIDYSARDVVVLTCQAVLAHG